MRRSTLVGALLGCALGCQFPAYGFLPCEPGSASCEDGPDGSAAAADADASAQGDACPPPIAADSFSRDGTGGFGPADIGGTWKVTDKANASVSDGQARVVMSAGAGSEAVLDQVSVLDIDETVVVASDKPCAPTDAGTSGIFAYVYGRMGPDGSYWVGLWITERNTVQLGITRYVQGVESTIELSGDVFGIEYAPGMRLRIRARYQGTNPTRISGKIWQDGVSEPAAWTVEATDATPELQVPGAPALKAYLSSRATNAPVTMTFDDFVVRAPGTCGD